MGLTDTAQRTREDVSRAMLDWKSDDFEREAASKGMCAFAVRSFEHWDKHPQGQALSATPPVTIVKIGEAPKRIRCSSSKRPLEGIRVLDLSRVLAGPIAGRTLAGTRVSSRHIGAALDHF